MNNQQKSSCFGKARQRGRRRLSANANGRPVRLSLVKLSWSGSVPSSREAFGSQLKCRAKRRVVGRDSGISGDYVVELWLTGVLSLKATPGLQNPTIWSISVRVGGVSVEAMARHITSPAPEHNVADCVNISVLPNSNFESIHNH
ncbi:hypothetical protein F5888DRAFT_1636034 [Russula emetica]|nr:hypothetical protein F5888DRAFT_1636034 [Russula emetica]